MNTEPDPEDIAAVCGAHFLPAGFRCTDATSPTLAAPRPLIFTSPEPLAIA